jgi:hypothetical protein
MEHCRINTNLPLNELFTYYISSCKMHFMFDAYRDRHKYHISDKVTCHPFCPLLIMLPVVIAENLI